MKKMISSISLAFACLLYTSNAQAQAKLVQTVEKKGDELVIPYQKYILPNGLTVILTEDHSDPIVQVDVTYHVGSAREEIGKSGFAHFFEHMMFAGSDHVPNGNHFKIINAAGGSLNGTTNQDRTNYFETVPNNQLEKMLWLESDRMGFLLDAVTQQKFELQRSTVKNERGQNYDNRPYGLVDEAISRALYPYGHPYSWPIIGYVKDLNSVDVNDLKRFFLRWYGPNNATLTIGGDINPKQTLAWVEKYFSSIPSGPMVQSIVLPAPVVNSDRYVSYTDNYASLPKLYIVYPGVKLYDKDHAALDALAMIFGQNRNSLLYQELVKKRKAAEAVMASNNQELAGGVSIVVTPFPGQSLVDIKKSVDGLLIEFEKRGITDDDMIRFKSGCEDQFISGLASVSGKVRELALAQTVTGNPNQVGNELENIRNVTKADVMRVYDKYIKGKGAVVLSVLPLNGNVAPAAPDNYTVNTKDYKAPDYGYAGLTYHKAKDSFDRNIQPPAGPTPVVKVPAMWTTKMANGIKITGSYNNEIPTVNLILSVKGGGVLVAKNPLKAGLPLVMEAMLNDDTQQHTAEELSVILEKMGSRLNVLADAEEISFYVYALTKNLDATLALLQERILHPKFTQEALERIKKQMIQDFQNSKTNANRVASNVFSKILYGADNIRTYGFSGNAQTVQNITLADVQACFNQYIVPNLASLVVVGDVSESTIKRKLGILNGWIPKPVTLPLPNMPSGAYERNTIYFVDIPRAAQSDIRIGYLTGINYDATGQYYKLGLVNYALGGDFSSRLNLNLREDKGWTYGAQSNFVSGKNGGRFTAAASVRSSSTDSAVVEFVKEISAYAKNGITPAELTFAKSAIGLSEALKYETNTEKAVFLSLMQQYDLKPAFVDEQAKILADLTKAEADRLAKKYLDTAQMTILVVGDKEKVMPRLQKLGYKIVELDADGKIK